MNSDLYTTCLVKLDSTVLPDRQGEFAAIARRDGDLYELMFWDGTFVANVPVTELESFRE